MKRAAGGFFLLEGVLRLRFIFRSSAKTHPEGGNMRGEFLPFLKTDWYLKNDKNFPPSPSYPPYHQRPIAHRKEQKPLLTM